MFRLFYLFLLSIGCFLSANQDEAYIRQCIQLAQSARDYGNHPFGALLVWNGEVIASAENSVVTEGDCTCHAELNLIRIASRTLTKHQLQDSTLYTSTEPCAMCAGAIYWSGISRVVYGCPADALERLASGSFVVPCEELWKYGKRQIAVTGPVLQEASESVHIGFWQ